MMKCQKDKFNLDDNSVYLNCAYMSPMLKSVEEAGIEGIRKKRNPFEVAPEDFFADTEKLREAYARLIGTSEASRTVVIPSVSYGIANVAANIHPGKKENIVVLGEQFPSNYYSWKRLSDESDAELRVVQAPDGYSGRGERWNAKILESIDENTKAVAMAHVHWADGTLFDLRAIRKRTLEVGALLIIDGTQSVGALPFHVEEIKPDALICAGYKWLMGPYSIGMAYYGSYFDEGRPIEENWINRLKSENFSGLVAYEDRYQAGALRYEVGEHSNFIQVPMMLEAVNQINQWGVDSIQKYCRELISIDSLKQLNLEDEQYRAAHLFGIQLPNADLAEVKAILAKRRISVSIRGSAIRVSPHVYNTKEEIELLASELLRT